MRWRRVRALRDSCSGEITFKLRLGQGERSTLK